MGNGMREAPLVRGPHDAFLISPTGYSPSSLPA